jgi:TonB family protein
VIEQRGSWLKITSTSKDWNVNKPIAVTLFAMMVPELSITTDNQENVQPYGPGQMRSKSRWEDSKLITDWTLERDGQVMVKGQWVRSLSSDGKAQTVQITAHDPIRNLDGEAKAVFVKTGESVARGFLGTWRGDFQGKTFLVVTLEKAGDALGGTVSIGGFSIDDRGQVKQVNVEPNVQDAVPIFGAKWDGSLLSFRCKPGGWPSNTPEGAPTDLQFQMRLTGDSVAELRGLGPAPLPGQPNPEWSGWWKVSRQSVDSEAEVRPGGPSGGVVGGVAGGVKGGTTGGVVGGVNGGTHAYMVGVIGGIVGGAPNQQDKQTVDLSGTVSDPSGARVPSALVSLYGESGTKETAVTDDAGEFSFTSLAPGSYEWKVFRDGFEVTQQKLVISNGSLKSQPGRKDELIPGPAGSRLDIVLEPSSTMQSMVVTAPAPPEVVEKRHAAAPKRIRVGGQVEESKVLTRVPPVYPESARAKGVEGTVLLEAVISMEGVPLSLRVLESPDSDLSDAAQAAVRQWRYQPTLLNGQPIEVVTTIAIQFHLVG